MTGKQIAAIAAAAAGLAGASAAAVAAKKKSDTKKKAQAVKAESAQPYRNTELGRHEKTAKAFITQTETTRHLPARKNPKASTKSTPIL